MLIYVLSFGISIFFAFRADSLFRKNKKKSGIIYSIISIMCLVLLATFRGISVGKDTSGYVSILYDMAINSNTFAEYWKAANFVEIGYRLLCYIVSVFTTKIGYLYLISEVLVVVPIYYSFYRLRDRVSIGYGMLYLCLLFYSHSLSMVRQAIAISFLTYSFVCLINNEKIKTFLNFSIAILFHNSSIAFVIIYILYKIINSNKAKKMSMKMKTLIFLILILVMFIIMIFYENIIMFIGSHFNIISLKYLNYFNSKLNLSENNFLVFDTIYSIFWVFLGFLIVKKTNNKNEDFILLYMLVIDLTTIIISSKMSLFFRFGLIFGIPAKLIVLPQINNAIKKDKYNRILLNVLILLIVGGYWFYTEIIRNNYGIYPYIFNFDNIR